MSALTFDSAIVAQIMDEALKFCAQRTGFNGKEHAFEALHKGDCCVCEYLRYALGKGVGEYLGSVDDTIRAVYCYEPEYGVGSEGGAVSTGMSLVAHVSRKSAALSSVVASLGAALAEERQKLGCPNATARCFDLDVKLADDAEVQMRRGYGALINSPWVQPVEVWSRSV
jgi:hypothetical protein